MQRNRYDKSSLIFGAGRIGSLQTLKVIPVVAGETIELDIEGSWRLSQLRRNLQMDAKVDVFVFHVKHRHIYPNWTTFLEEGIDETVTLDTITPAISTHYTGAQCAGGVAYPAWLHRGYAKIYNYYFRNQTDDSAIMSESAALTDARRVISGQVCCHLDAIWNSGIDDDIDTSDYQITLGGSVLDLRDLVQLKGRLRSETEQNWFGRRYNDLLRSKFGATVNEDADERPTVLARESFWLSGFDVDGTADANLGQVSGKAVQIGGIRLLPKFIEEHGVVWIMALLRFNPVHEKETHFLVNQSQPLYEEISGDPAVVGVEPPVIHQTQDFFVNGNTTALGTSPYGQWYRSDPSYAHVQYENLQGFSFLKTTPASLNAARYIDDADYDHVFASVSMLHWQCQLRCLCQSISPVPDPRTSVFAGSR